MLNLKVYSCFQHQNEEEHISFSPPLIYPRTRRPQHGSLYYAPRQRERERESSTTLWLIFIDLGVFNPVLCCAERGFNVSSFGDLSSSNIPIPGATLYLSCPPASLGTLRTRVCVCMVRSLWHHRPVAVKMVSIFITTSGKGEPTTNRKSLLQ